MMSDRSQTALKIQKAKSQYIDIEKNRNKIVSSKFIQDYPNFKRESETNIETKTYQKNSKKKINYSHNPYHHQKPSNELKIGSILNALKEQDDNQFCLQIQSMTSQINDYYNTNLSNQKIVFPDIQLPQLKQSSNELLTRTIQIMSNKNQKISIPIHQGLFKSNTSHKNQFLDEKWNNIPSICDFKLKNQYSQSIEFIREYKSGYIPIQMQKRNNQQIQEQKKDTIQSPVKGQYKDKSRNHFIRKQQSTLTLPRTCGVSYIKPSQSLLTQKLPFEPLPPLIYQGSTSCFIGSNGEELTTLDFNKKQLIQKFNISLENSWLPFIVSEQDEMRNLLLGKRTKNAKVGFVEGIQNLWPLYVEGSFILIMVGTQKLLTQSQVWEAFQNKLSYFKIGILAKKSTSGKKAFLKSIKTQINDNASMSNYQTNQNQIKDEMNTNFNLNKVSFQTQNHCIFDQKNSPQQQRKVSDTLQCLQEQLKDCRTVSTMSLRLQMYVQEMDWKQKFTKQNKDILNELIMSLKDRLQKKSIKIICQRFQRAREDKINTFQQKFAFLRKGKIASQIQRQNVLSQNPQISNELVLINFIKKQNEIFELNQLNKKILFSNSEISSASQFLKNIASQQLWRKALKFPLYYISTRDSFAFDLIEKKQTFKRQNGKQYTKIDYYFYPDNVPTNFGTQYRKLFPSLDVGVTAYHDFFTQQELKQFQQKTFSMEKKAFKNKFLQMTVQPSIVSTKIKRTKFFFGYRYMWTRCQLSQPCSYVGAGVRKDVAAPPSWTKKISQEMEKQNIVQKNFINSIAINVYHDGKQGLAQHFDDAVRFKQPIYTLRLFSDARLSFGSQFYGFCNGAFIIPLPRGCVLVMQQNSYAANGVKHCVRPCDMTGKSAAVILRQMHFQVVSQASKYDQLIDFPAWFSCLSQNQNSITYAEQKRLESQQIMKGKVE